MDGKARPRDRRGAFAALGGLRGRYTPFTHNTEGADTETPRQPWRVTAAALRVPVRPREGRRPAGRGGSIANRGVSWHALCMRVPTCRTGLRFPVRTPTVSPQILRRRTLGFASQQASVAPGVCEGPLVPEGDRMSGPSPCAEGSARDGARTGTIWSSRTRSSAPRIFMRDTTGVALPSRPTIAFSGGHSL